MNQLFNSLPKTVLVALLLCGGVLLIILLDPPHNICDTQVSQFKESQKTFLYEGGKKVLNKPTLPDYDKLFNICIQRNSSGGCAELVFRMKEMLRDMQQATEVCEARIASESKVKTAIWQSVELLARGAWGTTPPRGSYDKFGWLTTADINLYCQLQATALSVYPKSQWEAVREKLMQEFAKKHNLDRKKVWPLILFSTRCSNYI